MTIDWPRLDMSLRGEEKGLNPINAANVLVNTKRSK